MLRSSSTCLKIIIRRCFSAAVNFPFSLRRLSRGDNSPRSPQTQIRHSKALSFTPLGRNSSRFAFFLPANFFFSISQFFLSPLRRSRRLAAPFMSTGRNCVDRRTPACSSNMEHIRELPASPCGCLSFHSRCQSPTSACHKSKAGRFPRNTMGEDWITFSTFPTVQCLVSPSQRQQQNEAEEARLQLEPLHRRLCEWSGR